ncbi:hypothetical protein [Sporosarcina sp. YIM B06819]|uniref:hypothetical protein n=1 Tax=Sporosarcina sp. YIM B06819 TaxID=3081769 RepID=UPI00298C7D30|nr:hypothetical protein [Sporosarcina sp. YIM B06819]
MKYMFTDPNTHIDFGFGLNASNFHSTANYLWENNPDRNTIGLLPNLYLYRHSIELYLKSLIVIIHKKLKLDYKDGAVPFDSREPFILYEDPNGKRKWNKMTSSHFISTLYEYLEKLVREHEYRLREEASQELSVIINPDNRRIVDHIKKYDDGSTYFRYSNLGESIQNTKESEKNYNKKIEIQDLQNHIDIKKPSSFFVIINPDSGEAVEAHKGMREMPLKELAEDMRKLVEYLSGIHAMFRVCLCNGY